MNKTTGTAAKKKRSAADSSGGNSERLSLMTVKLNPQIATTRRAISTSRKGIGAHRMKQAGSVV